MGLSIRAYAAHRGVSHTSVRKAIASGRLTTGPDGTIDPEKADRAWVRNADPSKAPGAQALKPVPAAAVGAVKDTLLEAGAPVIGGMSYLHAKTAEKVLTVQLLREKLRREKGEVVERDYAIEQGFSFARRLRDQWLGWPARVSALMAADLAHRHRAFLVAQRPSFWIEFGSRLGNARLPLALGCVSKRMLPEKEAAWRQAERRGQGVSG